MNQQQLKELSILPIKFSILSAEQEWREKMGFGWVTNTLADTREQRKDSHYLC